MDVNNTESQEAIVHYKVAWLNALCAIAREAGDAILAYYDDDIVVEQKADDSPVTKADLAAHHVIVNALQLLTPDLPIISEESEAHINVADGQPFWLVDPLDGTKSFIRKEGEFTVNIALIEDGQPVLGVVYLPVGEVLYAGHVGQSAFREDASGRRPISVRDQPEEGLDVIVSRAHLSPKTDAFLKEYTVRQRVKSSSSLKFCAVAEGEADMYPRLGTTMEWDTAAGHAVLSAAGGSVETPEGQPYRYNKPGFKNGHFVAWGKK